MAGPTTSVGALNCLPVCSTLVFPFKVYLQTSAFRFSVAFHSDGFQERKKRGRIVDRGQGLRWCTTQSLIYRLGTCKTFFFLRRKSFWLPFRKLLLPLRSSSYSCWCRLSFHPLEQQEKKSGHTHMFWIERERGRNQMNHSLAPFDLIQRELIIVDAQPSSRREG